MHNEAACYITECHCLYVLTSEHSHCGNFLVTSTEHVQMSPSKLHQNTVTVSFLMNIRTLSLCQLLNYINSNRTFSSVSVYITPEHSHCVSCLMYIRTQSLCQLFFFRTSVACRPLLSSSSFFLERPSFVGSFVLFFSKFKEHINHYNNNFKLVYIVFGYQRASLMVN